jgi:HAD superfamily hydrolase (TIGR01490 family)
VSQRIAFFDFDGTITTKDTLLEFIRFSRSGIHLAVGFVLNSPWLIAMKLKLISNQSAKERILTHFFGGQPLALFDQHCDAFSREVLPRLIRQKAVAEITRLREAGATVVIVSASPENWIKQWAAQAGAELIATRLAVFEDKKGETRLTGRIEGNNCHGEEKVSRIRQRFALPDYNEIYTYGDTGGDKPMLRLGTASFFKPFQ